MSGCCSVNAQGIAIGVSLVSGNAPLIIGITGTGTKRTAVVTIDGSGFYELNMWLIDDATKPNEESNQAPSETGTTRWNEVTLSDGTFSFDIDHSGAARSWYLAVSLGGKVTISTVLAFT